VIYELNHDIEHYDEDVKKGTNTIYANRSNLKEIEYVGIKKGYFKYIITDGKYIDDWPKVEFYYNSKTSSLESEYLVNIVSWPIIHKKVKEEFEKQGITGIQYLPIKLIDEITNKESNDYVVMNVLNMIEAIDLEKSEYKYNEKYDFYSFIPVTTYFDEEVCGKYDIFRASKDKIDIYVSQKIKDIVESNGWIGFEFSGRLMSQRENSKVKSSEKER